jgi:hypothetical protein
MMRGGEQQGDVVDIWAPYISMPHLAYEHGSRPVWTVSDEAWTEIEDLRVIYMFSDQDSTTKHVWEPPIDFTIHKKKKKVFPITSIW